MALKSKNINGEFYKFRHWYKFSIKEVINIISEITGNKIKSKLIKKD